jgi:drug/metabolite transporter (DMT)-like permease
MRRTSGYIDGLVSGVTWGIVAVLLTGQPARMSGHSAVALPFVVAGVFDAAAALFLVARCGFAGALPRAVGLVMSRTAITVAACSLLGGPIFMGGYVAAVMLAGPSDAVTATATYPVLGALLAQLFLGQRLKARAWLGVVATAIGAALTALDASSAVDSLRTLLGIGLALVGAAGLALEGVVATRAMASVDADTVMTVREVFSALLFTVVILAVPDGIHTAAAVLPTPGQSLPVIIAGFIGGYSFAIWYRSIRKIGVAKAMALNITYAMWGTLFAWLFHRSDISLLAAAGCVVVTAGTAFTIVSATRGQEVMSDDAQESLDTQGVT